MLKEIESEMHHIEDDIRTAAKDIHQTLQYGKIFIGVALVVVVCCVATVATVVMTRELSVDGHAETLTDSKGHTLGTASTQEGFLLNTLNDMASMDALGNVDEVTVRAGDALVVFKVMRIESVNSSLTLHGTDGVKLVIDEDGGEYFGQNGEAVGEDHALGRRQLTWDNFAHPTEHGKGRLLVGGRRLGWWGYIRRSVSSVFSPPPPPAPPAGINRPSARPLTVCNWKSGYTSRSITIGRSDCWFFKSLDDTAYAMEGCNYSNGVPKCVSGTTCRDCYTPGSGCGEDTISQNAHSDACVPNN